jgi:hypothetical protein
VPVEWAQDFIRRNPNDYHRIGEAYASEGGPKQQTPQYQTPTQAWNAQPSTQPGAASDLYAMLMQRAQQGPVTGQDANVRAQVDPVVAQQTRASRGYLNDLAEKAGPLANLQGERRLASERSGQAAGALESEVIGRLQSDREQQIMQALSLAGSQLSDQQRNALQMQLAQLQDQRAAAGQQLQSQSLSQSNDQFLRELALREANQNNQWDFNWATLGA